MRAGQLAKYCRIAAPPVHVTLLRLSDWGLLMPEPRIDSLKDLQFRDRGAPTRFQSAGPDRFWLAVAIFLVVAMLYPFYSYAVHSYLLAREVRAATAQASQELERFGANLRREAAESRRVAATEALRERQRGVSVAGTTVIGGRRIVIVNLGEASLAEARATICGQAERYFREPLAGERLHIQRHRGNRPAVDAGSIVCE